MVLLLPGVPGRHQALSQEGGSACLSLGSAELWDEVQSRAGPVLQYFQSGWGKGEDPLCSRVSQLSDKHAREVDPLCGTAESQLFQLCCLHPASDSRSLGLQSKAGGSGRLDLTQASRVAAL